MPNPFEVTSAELMQPQQVAEEFVRDHTEHSKLASHSHTVIWGSRGSGKSMHLRFMEPVAQAFVRDSVRHGDVERMLSDPDAFVGIYINCRDPILNRVELRSVGECAAIGHPATSLLTGYLTCCIMKRLCECIAQQVTFVCPRPVDVSQMPQWLRHSTCGEAGTVGQLLSGLSALCDQWLYAIYRLIVRLLLEPQFLPAPGMLPEDAPRGASELLDLLEWLCYRLMGGVPFFLLVDEANSLCPVHQRFLNTLMGFRSQKYACVKVASQRMGFRVGISLDGLTDETHDYTSLDLDGLYTNNREAYYKRIMRIANDRLRRSGLEGVDITEYLPENPGELAALERAREIAARRWAAMPEDTRPNDIDNYIKKYAPAIVFQELSPKSGRTYAGFENIVHLSSGIVRSFLDCCSRMYTRYMERYPGQEPRQIPVSIQGEVIRGYSDEMIQAQLVERLRSLPVHSAERELHRKLQCLLQGMGALYRHRLMDRRSREPRIISVSLKDDPSPGLAEVLDLAVKEAFLQEKWYRSKRGNRNLKCYVLNRRLCPHFNLDLTGFQGRFEISSEDMAVALDDSAAFVRRVAGRGDDSSEADPGQLLLFDM